MRKIFLVPIFIILIVFIVIIFHKQIINYSIPFIKVSIQKQLNILDHDNTSYNIETDFKNKILILEIKNPVFKKNKYFELGYARSIIVEKKFINLLDKNIDKIIIVEMNALIKPNELKDFNHKKDSFLEILYKNLSRFKRVNEFSMLDSNFDLNLIINKHQIYISSLYINNKNNFIKSSGIINNDIYENIYKIENLENNKSIKLNAYLKSYSFQYLKNSFDLPLFDTLIDSKYNGQINILFNEDYENFEIDYKLTSLSNKISISGLYESKNNYHNSVIAIQDIKLSSLLRHHEILKSVKLDDLETFNINIKIEKNLENYNFDIRSITNNIKIYGKFRDNQYENINIEGNKIALNQIINKLSKTSINISNPFYDEMLNKNAISFKIKYSSKSGIINFKIDDSYNNIIISDFDLNKNNLDKFEIIFFENKSNRLIFNKLNSSFKLKFNNEFIQIINEKFKINIYDHLKLKLVKTFETAIFEGLLVNDFIKKITYNNYNIIKNFNFKIQNAKINKNEINFLNNIIDFEGPIDIVYEQDNLNNYKKINIYFDQTKIEINKIKFIKNSKEPLLVSFNYRNNSHKKIVLDNLEIKGKQVLIKGKVFIENNLIKKIDLSKFNILRNNLSLKFNNALHSKNMRNPEFDIFIKGNVLDLSYLNIRETKSIFSNIFINLDINVDKLHYINETNFSDAKLNAKFYNVWQDLRFNGKFESGGNIDIVLESKENTRNFIINSSDAGKALKIKKITKSINGGNLYFTGDYNSLENDNLFDANLVLKDFAIKKKSKIANFIKVIRIFDIKQQLKGDTEDFEYANMKIEKDNKIFKITEGKAHGGLMALTFEGNIDKNNDNMDITGLVAPTYAIDNWVSKIPVIGDILTGSKGEGFIAANFSVTGLTKKPQYFVNPLSVLTPGVFKNFWKIFGDS